MLSLKDRNFQSCLRCSLEWFDWRIWSVDLRPTRKGLCRRKVVGFFVPLFLSAHFQLRFSLSSLSHSILSSAQISHFQLRFSLSRASTACHRNASRVLRRGRQLNRRQVRAQERAPRLDGALQRRFDPRRLEHHQAGRRRAAPRRPQRPAQPLLLRRRRRRRRRRSRRRRARRRARGRGRAHHPLPDASRGQGASIDARREARRGTRG